MRRTIVLLVLAAAMGCDDKQPTPSEPPPPTPAATPAPAATPTLAAPPLGVTPATMPSAASAPPTTTPPLAGGGAVVGGTVAPPPPGPDATAPSSPASPTLTDSAGPGTGATRGGTADARGADVPLADALKGLRGKGPLVARMDVETAGVKGTFVCELFDDKAPKTVANFVALARGLRAWKDPKSGEWVKRPLYDGSVFHRVIPEFMIQGGDPKGNGTGDPGYEFADEIHPELRLDKGGVLAMANRGPGTNGSQFFITEKETPWLTGRHTVFGQCDNLELEKKLARVPSDPRGNRPLSPVVLKKVTIQRGRK